MLIEVTGNIKFEPEHVTKKHIKQYDWKRTAIVHTECDLYLYYAWFIRKRFNLELIRPLRGTHMTFINEVVDYEKFEEAKKIFDNKPLKFYHGIEPRSNGDHWWLRAYSQEAEEIRTMLGLERHPFFTFHVTIGRAAENILPHSRYILEKCKEFGILSSDPRPEFESQKILKF